jgi:hypothetical protein
MPIKTAYSTKALPDAVIELKNRCGDCVPRAVLFFSSSARYDAAALSRQMHQAFPGACVTGCSTAGEIAGGGMRTGSVAAMFLDDEIVADAASVVVERIGSELPVEPALRKLERHFQAPVSSWDLDTHVGLVLADGLSGAEERLMEKLGDATDVAFVGGSAGDDLKFERTYVMDRGNCYSDAAALLVLRLKRGFEIVKTQSFQPAGKTLVATKVDERSRTVIEFNGRPALDAYAEALGVTPELAPSLFFENPLGLMIEREPFVRSPQRAEQGSIVFYCHIKEDTELALLRATDIVSDTRMAVEGRNAVGKIRGLIDFQCILRTLQLRKEGKGDEYGAVFEGIPAIGFSTYGEAYLGHMNQTSTMLLFR